MRIGILFDNRKQLDLNVAVRMAMRQFEHTDHCAGYAPAEVHFNPLQVPEELEIDGLTILPDEQVKMHHIRVTTCDLSPQEEFDTETREFERRVSQNVLDDRFSPQYT